MAKFNDTVIDEIQYRRECGMYLQGCLSKSDLKKLEDNWNKIGGFKTIPWWKFVFENVEVKLKGDF